MNGQSIAQFEIIEQIGQGGMGVVYKARDTRLNRIVALKVLPADRVNDAARRSRFTQEAQAASALNHPNIVTIYDILHQEGMQAIAMEFVKGRTLESLAGRKGLPLADVLKYSLQIADALAAAHAAGIVHRDLKPGNVMVTESGAVKVLDFGLAKLTEPAGDDEATRSMRLEDAPKTEEGTLVGTVAYMSPEQAEGKKVDARSDIFSFGVMLYEMVTGRRAFQGDSRLSILSAILRDEPKPPSQWGEPIPRDLEKIIARCMRKDPARRFQHMDDLKVALQDLKEESESGVLMAEVPAVVSKRRSTWLLPVGIAALMIAAGAAWWLTRPQKPAAVPDVRRVTFDSGMTISPALSPDGKLLAYASDRAGDGKLDIWLQQVSGGDAVRLTKLPDDEDMPAFSPDGSKIAFLYRSRNEPGIYVISTLGGEPRRVTARGARASSSGKFSPDGNWIVYTAIEGVRNAIFVMPSGGGAPRRLAESFYFVAAPIWSADGKHILFFGSREEKGPFFERSDWWVTPAEGGPPVRTGIMQALVRQGVARYPDARPNFPHAWAGNRILFSVASNDIENLWEIFLNPKTFHADGEARQLTFGTAREHGPSVAANGSLAFTAVSTNTDFWSLPLDADTGKPKGEIRQVTRNSAADSDSIASLTADGKAILFCSSKSGNADIWRRDLETGSETPVIATPAAEHFGRASSDGSRILYGKAEAGETVVYLSSAAATQRSAPAARQL